MKKIHEDDISGIGSLFLFLLIFTQLFSHRYGVIDVSLIISGLFFLLISFPNFNIKYDKNLLSLLYILLLIFLYSLISFGLHERYDTFQIGRLARTLISLLILPTIIFYFKPSLKTFLNIVSLCIFFHCISILIQVLFEEQTIPIFAAYTGLSELNYIYGDLFIENRGFGLCRSFDKAGLFACIGIIVNLYLYFSNKENRLLYLFLIIFSFIAGLFTGRTFMVIGTLTALLAIFMIFFNSKSNFDRILIISASLFIFFFVIKENYQIVYASYIYFRTGEIISAINIRPSGIEGMGYYIGSLNVVMSFFKVPDTNFELFFGGQLIRSAYSDAGIIKIIYSLGLIGLILHLIFYYRYLRISLINTTSLQKYLLIIPILLIIFAFDIKDNNILSKNITEFIILLISVLIIKISYEDRNSPAQT